MTVQADRDIRSICVVGAGIVGMSAALAFACSLPQARLTLLATPDDNLSSTERLPLCQPSVRQFHALIGVQEIDLVQNGAATHRLATRYGGGEGRVGWSHVIGEYGLPAGAIPFHQLWLRARQDGSAASYDNYSLAALLATENKFVHPDAKPGSPLSNFDYALRLDPDPYRHVLSQLCNVRKIEQTSGEPTDIVLRPDGGVAAVRLADGREIEADLFIDCTSELISKLSDMFEDWRQWMPCDRLRFADQPCDVAQSSDRVEFNENGWQLEVPMIGHKTVVTAGAAEDAIPLRTGRLPEPWVRNVLAIGDAAITLAPLVPVSLTLAHNAILRALALLPGRDCHPLELREYNRRSAQEAMRVRDFVVLQYLTVLGETRLPDSLAHTLDQFRTRGRLPFYEEEIFGPQQWVAALLGNGIFPEGIDPAAGGIDMQTVEKAMQRFASNLSSITQRVPRYPDYLAQMKAAPR